MITTIWWVVAIGGVMSNDLISLTLGCSEQSIQQYNSTFNFQSNGIPDYFASTDRFTIRTNGLCGQTCRNGPRRWNIRGYQDKFIVTWTSVVSPNNTWNSVGHISTFKFTPSDGFSLISTFTFPECIDMGGIATNSDGSVIGVLCLTLSTTTIAGAINLVDTKRSADCDTKFPGVDNQFNGTCGAGIYNCYPIGWMNDRSCGADRNKKAFLLEWTGGQVTQTPNHAVWVNGASGGWNFGNWEVMLNNNSSMYYIDLKVTANSHEGETHFGISRSGYTYVSGLTDGWACGPGHVEANRVAHNEATDQWAVVCLLDWCASGGTCNSMYWRTVPVGTPKEVELIKYTPTGQSVYVTSGGPMNIISLGKNGWMAAAIGGNPISSDTTTHRIGTIKLPTNVSLYNSNPSKYVWNWLSTPPSGIPNVSPRVGMANLMNFGLGGEDSGRILLGWSPSMKTQGITSEYVVAEVDPANGNILGAPFTLNNTGWGEDNVWGYLPNSGCVVFAFAWKGETGPGTDYGIIGQSVSGYSNTMRLTALCPTGPAPLACSGTERRYWKFVLFCVCFFVLLFHI